MQEWNHFLKQIPTDASGLVIASTIDFPSSADATDDSASNDYDVFRGPAGLASSLVPQGHIPENLQEALHFIRNDENEQQQIYEHSLAYNLQVTHFSGLIASSQFVASQNE